MTKLIEGFTHHTIDENGVVINTETGHCKAQWLGANGYMHVDIQEFGIAKKFAIHRLLAINFIPNLENKRTVNHKDGNKLNNTLSNLEWTTVAENVKHAYDNGLQPYRRNYTLEEYEGILQSKFLKGESITSISTSYNQSLTQLSLHLREAAERLGLLADYENQLLVQKAQRAKSTGLKQRNIITLHMVDIETNEVLHVFSSITEAKHYLGKKSCGPISNVLAGRQKSAYGYFWVKL